MPCRVTPRWINELKLNTWTGDSLVLVSESIGRMLHRIKIIRIMLFFPWILPLWHAYAIYAYLRYSIIIKRRIEHFLWERQILNNKENVFCIIIIVCRKSKQFYFVIHTLFMWQFSRIVKCKNKVHRPFSTYPRGFANFFWRIS